MAELLIDEQQWSLISGLCLLTKNNERKISDGTPSVLLPLDEEISIIAFVIVPHRLGTSLARVQTQLLVNEDRVYSLNSNSYPGSIWIT